ncbi:MAG: peptidylprolyl isomerase [Gemmatimonadota bacterium]|nr:peptidylprolyl isomerase [Gemmatimonadota bacterium]
MTRRLHRIVVAALLVVAAGCAGDGEPAAETEEPPAAEQPVAGEDPIEPAGEAAAPGADETPTGDAVNPLMNPADPEMNEMAPATFRVRLETSKGDVVLELHRAWAPNGVDRLYNLVRNGFYDGTRFFRVLDGFVAQFGINGEPSIQAGWRGANIPGDPVVEGNTRGRLTYAMGASPDTRSTQLFINYADNSSLDSMGFAALGEVVEGMDVVDALYSGYGEGAPRGGGPNQALIQGRGNEYLNAEFPDLDYIVKAEIID